jgi:hypothetical protein
VTGRGAPSLAAGFSAFERAFTGGVYTPGAVPDGRLIDRLAANAGMNFAVES